jgi:peptidoglycan/LPS O-acetylase OafA/YrhL
MIFHELLPNVPISRTLEVFLLTLSAALASYYLVELPFRYRNDRIADANPSSQIVAK